MQKSPEMKRFEEDLRDNRELREKMDAVCRRIVEEGSAHSDAELLIRAAKELGYDIGAGELDRAAAAAQELDPDEMTAAAGGKEERGKCLTDYMCVFSWKTNDEDDKGHNSWCFTAWHCFAATLHTATDEHKTACFADHTCVYLAYGDWNHDDKGEGI